MWLVTTKASCPCVSVPPFGRPVVPDLPGIGIPTLVIHGESDQLMPVENARKMAQANPQARFVGVPGAGHMSNLENCAFFNRAVEEFLAEVK